MSYSTRPSTLQRVIDDHKAWLDSNGKRGIQLNLSNADIRDALFVGADLRKANFAGADISEGFMMECNLDGATLTKSSMRGTKIRHVDLRGSDFTSSTVDSSTKFIKSNLERVRSKPKPSASSEQSHAERIRAEHDSGPSKERK